MAKTDAVRKSLSALIDRLHSIGGGPAARHLEVSEATITRMKNEQLENNLDLIDFLGFKVVPKETVCHDPKTISALMHFAKKAMAQLDSAEDLESW